MIKALIIAFVAALSFGTSVSVADVTDAVPTLGAASVTEIAAISSMVADTDCPDCIDQTERDVLACEGGCPVPCAFSIGSAVMPSATAVNWSLRVSLAPRFAVASFLAGVSPPPDLSPPRWMA